MIIGVPAESFPGERRVALVPAAVPALVAAGHEVLVERGAGDGIGCADALYADRGARTGATRAEVFAAADALVQVLGPGANDRTGRDDLPLLRPGQALIAFQRPLGDPRTVDEIARTGAIAFAVDLMPRITRAQSMDALSSMATVAGFKAVVLAAAVLPRLFPMLTTAAGTIPPARVFVIGAGVSGLQAIATARRLGAAVSGYDIRPAASEQIRSLGARAVELPIEAAEAEDRQGYARPQDEAFHERQRQLLAGTVARSDVVVTTAATPGRRAPVLVTADMVKSMPWGAVIVDLAAEQGGNCELTRPDQTIVEHGVTIIGTVNLAATVPGHASQMYARNVSAFLLHLVAGGSLRLDPGDEIVRETLLTRDGEVVHPRVRAALGLPEQGGRAA
jgi:NAD(P) transhydrogenase subunit alpha